MITPGKRAESARREIKLYQSVVHRFEKSRRQQVIVRQPCEIPAPTYLHERVHVSQLAKIALLINDANARIVHTEKLCRDPSLRVVVSDYDLKIAKRLIEHRVKCFDEHLHSIVGGDPDREKRGF